MNEGLDPERVYTVLTEVATREQERRKTMETIPEITANEYATRLGLLLQEQNTLQRQTRNAARFIAWVVGVVVVLSLLGGIIVLANINSAANSGSDISNCLSLGGNDPSC